MGTLVGWLVAGALVCVVGLVVLLLAAGAEDDEPLRAEAWRRAW